MIKPFTLAAFFLAAGGVAAMGSPRGIEFSVSDDGDKNRVTFSIERAKVGSCYGMVGPMGDTVAAACLGETGWKLAGGYKWVFHEDGMLSAVFDGDPKVSRVYPEDERRVMGKVGAEKLLRLDLVDVLRTARQACGEKLILPEEAKARVTVTSDATTVLFGHGGPGGGGALSPLATAVIGRKTGLIERVELH